MLNKHKIFAADDMRYETIDMTKEWGGELRIRTMSVAEQLEYEKVKESGNSGDIVLGLVLRCCVDEKGDRLFDDKDLEELQKKSTNSVFKVFQACLELNSIKQDELEEEAKN